MVLLLVAACALPLAAQSLTCMTSSSEGMISKSCDDDTLADICYYSFGDGGSAGCVPADHQSTLFTTSEAACNDGACWCLENDCNTKDWAEKFKETYEPPSMCYAGIAGAIQEPECKKTKLYTASEFRRAECWSRSVSKKCVENNKHVGMGDGCSDHNDQSSCESYKPEGRDPRDADESFDGTTKHCRWAPEIDKAQKKDKCQTDDHCTFYDDRGAVIDGVHEGNCEHSDSSNTKFATWELQRGKDCELRTRSGCFENNAWMGQAERCTDHKTQDACLAQTEGCSEGTCSGNAISGTACAQRTNEHQCAMENDGNTGCTWKKQCCQFIPAPEDPANMCMTNGAGSMGGLCEYDDGSGLPTAEFLEQGFDYSMFRKQDTFVDKCALIASFRVDKGSAVALGSNKPEMISTACKGATQWRDLAEHTGHTSATIDEYCENLIPDKSAMAALSTHTPAFIIEKTKQGQFGAIMPGLKDLMYIITAKPELHGECLFFSAVGEFGAAVCTCDKKECNGKEVLKVLVDKETGPMRLLQFLDGSLSQHKEAVNGVLPGLLDKDGKINPNEVSKVTEAHVDEIMKLPGMSDLTNKEELWGIVQDFKKMLKAEDDYKTALMEDSTMAALKTDPTKVEVANTAAGCPLYDTDGIPNTVCLESLSDEQIQAVSDATGIPKESLKNGSANAEQQENGNADADVTPDAVSGAFLPRVAIGVVAAVGSLFF